MENENNTRGIVSLLPNTWEKRPIRHDKIKRIMQSVQEGRYKNEIENYRKIFISHGKKATITIKTKEALPCFMWSGIFQDGKCDKNFTLHSGIISLDIDGLTPETAIGIKNDILSCSFSSACLYIFLSPTLTDEIAGLKIGFAYDGSIPDKKTHKRAIRDLVDRLKAENINPATDKAAYSLSRLCYMSYDPDAYYNDSAFNNALPVPPEEEKPPRMKIKHVDHTAGRKTPEPGMKKSDAELLEEFRQADLTEIQKKMGNLWTAGQRHYCLLETGFFLAGSLAAGVITQADFDELEATATDKATDKEMVTWVDAVSEGEKAPLKTFDQRKTDRVAWAKSKQQAELPKTDEEYHELFFNEIIKEIRVIMAKDSDYQRAGTLAGEALRDGLIKQEDVDTLKKSILENALGNPDALGDFLSSCEAGKAGKRDPLRFEKMKTEKLKAEGKKANKKAKAKKDDAVKDMNRKYAMINIGGQVLIMQDTDDAEIFMKPADFKLWFRNRNIWLPKNDGGTTKKNIADIWMDSPDRREYNKVIFSPGIPDEPQVYNLWRGFAVEPKKGSWRLMENHIHDILCSRNLDQYEFFLKICSAIVHHCIDSEKNRRPETATVLKGIRGIGKDTFCELFGSIFGRHSACVAQKEHLLGKFNSSLQNCVFLHASETFWAGDKQAEGQLKAMITNPELYFEAKYRTPIKLENHASLFISSNEEWVVPAGAHERRFFVPSLSGIKPTDPNYFKNLRHEWATGGAEAMLYDLIHDVKYDQRDFDSPPKTAGLKDQVEISMCLEQQFWCECLDENIVIPWQNITTSAELHSLFTVFCDKVGHKKRIPRQATFMKSINKYSGLNLKPTTSREDTGKIFRCYNLPTVQEAQVKFNEYMGMKIYKNQ